MSFTEKLQSLFVIIAIFAGLALGQIQWIEENAASLIAPSLMVMLCGVFLNIPLNHLDQAFKNYKMTGLILGINFLWTPIFVWGLGAILLRDSPDLWIGLIMLMVTPCTDWYLIFTGIAKGNVALATALLPWNMILQMVLLPVYLLVFVGKLVQIDATILLESVVLVLAVPILLAFIAKWLIPKVNGFWREIPLKIAAGQTLFLCLAIAAVFASQGQTLIQRPDVLLKMLLPIFIFYGITFLLTQAIARLGNFSYEDFACFSCTTLARNSPLSLAIATSVFPDRPLITLVLAIEPLIELPVMVLVSQLLLFLRRKRRYS
ncbi:arsenic resistance protein [Nostoc sp. NZL]|uniref:arsenic resistance protein n=1 Tax=Nostoc sp. NZL TaxID=2650612 RepID=UPI0018C70344|nr:bile acid:sodium symporter [Nostoc sp. NZL]MBG1241360.1 arsenic resistance protein [Nostoc sp. NZL]